MTQQQLFQLSFWCFGIAFLIVGAITFTFLYLVVTHVRRKRYLRDKQSNQSK